MKKQTKEKLKKSILTTLHVIGYICIGLTLITGIAIGVNGCNSNVRQVNAESSFDIHANNISSSRGLKINQYDLYYLDFDTKCNSDIFGGATAFTITPNTSPNVYIYDFNILTQSSTNSSKVVNQFIFDNDDYDKLSGLGLRNQNNTTWVVEEQFHRFFLYFADGFTCNPNVDDLAIIQFNSRLSYVGNYSSIDDNYLINAYNYYVDNYIKCGQEILLPFVYDPVALQTFYFNYSSYAYLGLYDHNNYWYSYIEPYSSVQSSIECNYFYHDGSYNEGVADLIWIKGQPYKSLYVGCSLYSSSSNHMYLGISINKNSFIYNYFYKYCYLKSNAGSGYVNLDLQITSNYKGSLSFTESGIYNYNLTNASLMYNGVLYDRFGSVIWVNYGSSRDGMYVVGNSNQPYEDDLRVYWGSPSNTDSWPIESISIGYYSVNYNQFVSLIYNIDSGAPCVLLAVPTPNLYNNPIEPSGQAGVDQGVTGVFAMFTQVFDSLSSIFKIGLFGNITIGILIFIPLVVTILLFVVKLFKR